MSHSKRAMESIAHAALTNSKRPESFVKGIYPTHASHGKACYLYANGKRYTDYICGLGTNLLGYDNSFVLDAIKKEIDRGFSLSLGSELEVEFAENFKGVFPWVDRIRILKSGAEGCNAAIKIARTFTGRSLVVSQGYHGHGDEFVSLTRPANGIPKIYSEIMSYDDNLSLKLVGVAAVIIEPVIVDWSEKRVNWVKDLREQCTKNDIILIFDETITGLRFPGLSFSKWSGITPDIIILGKALGAGLPISVVGGRKDIMESDYFVSSTFAGERLSIAAAQATLQYLVLNPPPIHTDSHRFIEDFNTIEPWIVWIEGYGTRGIFKSKDELTLALFFQETCKAGLLFGPSFFWCLPHNEESNRTLELCRAILTRIRLGEVKLQGEMPVKPFAQKVRNE